MYFWCVCFDMENGPELCVIENLSAPTELGHAHACWAGFPLIIRSWRLVSWTTTQAVRGLIHVDSLACVGKSRKVASAYLSSPCFSKTVLQMAPCLLHWVWGSKEGFFITAPPDQIPLLLLSASIFGLHTYTCNDCFTFRLHDQCHLWNNHAQAYTHLYHKTTVGNFPKHAPILPGLPHLYKTITDSDTHV